MHFHLDLSGSPERDNKISLLWLLPSPKLSLRVTWFQSLRSQFLLMTLSDKNSSHKVFIVTKSNFRHFCPMKIFLRLIFVQNVSYSWILKYFKQKLSCKRHLMTYLCGNSGQNICIKTYWHYRNLCKKIYQMENNLYEPLSCEVMQLYTTLGKFSFTHQKYFLRASIICDF